MEDNFFAHIDERSASSLDAYLYVSPGKLSFGVKGETQAAVFLEEEVKSLRDFTGSYFAHPFMGFPYRSISLFFDSGGVYDLVPKPFCSDGQGVSLWLPGVSEDEVVMKEDFPDQDFSLTYSADKELREFAERSFSRHRYFHPASGLIQAALQSSRKSSHRSLFCSLSAHRGGNALDVVHVSNGKVLFANRFVLNGSADALYYITATWRSEGMDQEKDALCVYGDDLSQEMLQALSPLKKAISAFSLNNFSEFGRETPGVSDFPSLIRLKFLCA